MATSKFKIHIAFYVCEYNDFTLDANKWRTFTLHHIILGIVMHTGKPLANSIPA